MSWQTGLIYGINSCVELDEQNPVIYMEYIFIRILLVEKTSIGRCIAGIGIIDYDIDVYGFSGKRLLPIFCTGGGVISCTFIIIRQKK